MPSLPKNNSLQPLVALLVLAAGLAWTGVGAHARPESAAFGVAAREVGAGRSILMAKWEQAVARHRRSLARAEAACGASGRGRGCEVMEWQHFLGGLAGRPAAEQMAREAKGAFLERACSVTRLERADLSVKGSSSHEGGCKHRRDDGQPGG